MTNKKSTKRALLMSALSLLLCVSMLVGSTFAWFTDSVTSGVNKIVAGNLDVELEYATAPNGTYTSVEGKGDLFVAPEGETKGLWEPGHTEVAYLKVRNAGTLYLKYTLAVSPFSEVVGENADGDPIKLSEILKFYATEPSETAPAAFTRATAQVAASASDVKLNEYLKEDLVLAPGAERYIAVAVYMPESVGNEANYRGNKIPEIEFALTLVASQYTEENDSFGPDYDANALVCDILATPETIDAILADAEEGTVIGLAAGEYGTLTLPRNNLTLVSGAAVVGCLDLNEKDNITVDGLTFNAAKAQTAYDADGKDSGNVTNLTDGKAKNGGSVGIVVKNCTFVGVAADTDKYFPVYFGDSGRGNRSDNLTFENCEFKTNARQYIALNGITNNSGSTPGKVVVTNNIFGGNGFGTTHNTINATSSGVNWTISDNTFNNWNPKKTAIGSSRSTADGVLTWTVTNNVFNNVEDAVALALKAKTYNAGNTTVVFEGNTALNGNGILVETTRNAENDEDIYCGKKIQLKDNVVTASDNESLQNALKNLEDDSVVVLTDNVVVPSDWDARYTGGKTSKSVVVDGNGNTLKITGSVADNNYNAVFRFEGDAVVKNITIDLSEASGYGGTTARAISAKGNLTVDNCTFIGNTALSKARAIIFGEGQSAAQYDAEISITNSTFVNWSRGITDNENGKDVKSVVIEGNTCTNANIYVSAYENITVMNNKMSGALINITSYSAAATVKVVATGNALDASKNNVVGSASKLFNAANVTAQEGFVVNTIA